MKGDNADLMCEVFRVFDPGFDILDATYGKGNFWTKMPEVRDEIVTTNDLDPRTNATYNYDFRDLPAAWEGRFSTTVFDPPYVSMGGRKTSTLAAKGSDMADAYGMLDAPSTPQRLWAELLIPGVLECARVTCPGGLVMVKCMDYVSSGKLQPVFPRLVVHPFAGLAFDDYFILDSGPGPQPSVNLDGSPRRQVHAAHSGISYLVVYRKMWGGA